MWRWNYVALEYFNCDLPVIIFGELSKKDLFAEFRDREIERISFQFEDCENLSELKEQLLCEELFQNRKY